MVEKVAKGNSKAMKNDKTLVTGANRSYWQCAGAQTG
jgi:hypothetical protein